MEGLWIRQSKWTRDGQAFGKRVGCRHPKWSGFDSKTGISQSPLHRTRLLSRRAPKRDAGRGLSLSFLCASSFDRRCRGFDQGCCEADTCSFSSLFPRRTVYGYRNGGLTEDEKGKKIILGFFSGTRPTSLRQSSKSRPRRPCPNVRLCTNVVGSLRTGSNPPSAVLSPPPKTLQSFSFECPHDCLTDRPAGGHA